MTSKAVWPRLRPRLGSIQARLGLALGVLVLVVCVSLALLLSRAAETQVVRQSGANLEVLSRQLARELSAGMNGFTQAVITQTYRDRFRDPTATAASMREALDEFVRTNSDFAFVSIIDAKTDIVVAANGGIFEGGSATGRPVLEQGKRGLFVGDVHKAVRLAELLPKPANGEALRFLDVSAPVRDAAGNIIRVFATHIAWQWTDNIRSSTFGPLKEGFGVDAVLIDSEDKVVLAASSDLPIGTDLRALVALQDRSASVVKWPGGGDYLTVVSSTAAHGDFPGFGWRVIARQPLAMAAQAASNLRTAFLLGAIVLGLVGALLAWWATGRFLRPIRQLAQGGDDTRMAAISAISAFEKGPDSRSASGSLSEVAGVQRAMERMARTTRTQAAARHLSEQQFAALADSISQRVFQTDASGRVEYVNQAWLRISSTPEQLLRRPLETLFEQDTGAVLLQSWPASLKTGMPLNMRCLLMPHGQTESHWYDITARPVSDEAGTTTAWVGTLVDVHQVVLDAQTARQALRVERSAREEAEQMSKLRDDFLAVVSHELRSPLNVISGWAEILRRKGQNDPTAIKAAEVIRTHARQQAALIDDLLDATAVAAGKLVLNLQPTDLSQATADAVAAHLHAAQTKGVALNHSESPPCIIQGDQRRVTQMLANLMDNAIKFTDAGGAIDVKVQISQSEVRVFVHDTGRGIDPDFLPHVFEQMRQQDSSKTRRAGGLGLGLSIVQGLAALHRGSVTALSKGLGQGSTFILRFPLDTVGGIVGRPSPSVGEDADVIELLGCRILLVDDEPDAREMAQVALNSLGALVSVAASGAEALKILESSSSRFDVLVSDIGMPEMDGLMLIRQVRRNPNMRYLPAVALTAFAMESDRLAGLSAGFQAYVTKPISLRRLSEAVAQALAGEKGVVASR
ncbi:ATP-binding protein [Variovorax sp. RHLX14]|uniref:hybrid sensor histidine kinase/response regulator n=1 Tax=Variovorax sp. RHLX14 TaxID=1259731 RepID=UPI003F456A25